MGAPQDRGGVTVPLSCHHELPCGGYVCADGSSRPGLWGQQGIFAATLRTLRRLGGQSPGGMFHPSLFLVADDDHFLKNLTPSVHIPFFIDLAWDDFSPICLQNLILHFLVARFFRFLQAFCQDAHLWFGKFWARGGRKLKVHLSFH